MPLNFSKKNLSYFRLPLYSTSRFGLKADGTVRFHSGFVMSIDGASLDNRTHSNAINDDYVR